MNEPPTIDYEGSSPGIKIKNQLKKKSIKHNLSIVKDMSGKNFQSQLSFTKDVSRQQNIRSSVDLKK